MLIDEYVHRLDRALTGPGRLKTDLLTEARHGLLDAAEGYREAGLPAAEAERQAVAEFGAVPELAPAYQAELAVGAARRLTLRLGLTPLVVGQLAQFMWWGAPWTTTDVDVPGGYLLASNIQDTAGPVIAVLALATYALLRWWPRRRLAIAAGAGSVAAVAIALGGGALLYTWSALIWDAALTWPPMLLGGLAIASVYAWLARSAATCLRAARAAPAQAG